SIVIEAARLMCPEAFEGSGSITLVGRTFGLEVVDANLFGCVHVPARLGVDRWHVASRTLRLIFEQHCAACRRCRIETSGRRYRCGDRELVKLKRGKLRGNQIRIASHVAETGARGNREFDRIVET